MSGRLTFAHSREELVERADGHPGALGHALHGEALEAVVPDEPLGHLEHSRDPDTASLLRGLSPELGGPPLTAPWSSNFPPLALQQTRGYLILYQNAREPRVMTADS